MTDKKYISIDELSKLLNINKHVIRYWDSKFDGISTRLSNNKQRFFNSENIKKIKNLQSILYQDGKHNYSLDLAKKIINNTPKYYNPNSLEGKAQHYIQEDVQSLPDEMACFEKSFVINTPLNRVQETCHNGAGKFFGSTPEELNKRFIAGDRLTLEGMDFSTIIGVHQELKLCWEK